jgi:ribosomal protein S18 acetylase RimI-like enzyme
MRKSIETRILTLDDISKVFSIETEVGKMDVSLVIKSTESEILKCILSNLSIGVFHKEKLLGYTLCYVDEYESVAYIEKCATKEEYRGGGIHSATLSKCLNILREKNYIVAMALVSPTNSASMKNFQNCGFIKQTKRNNLYNCTNERNVMVCYLK